MTCECLLPETVTREPLCWPGDGTRRALANVLSLTLDGKPATVTFDSDERLEVVWARERVSDTEHMPTLVRANVIACRDEMS